MNRLTKPREDGHYEIGDPLAGYLECIDKLGQYEDANEAPDGINRGSIIQANEQAGDWCGCVLIVDEVKNWGCQAFIHIPFQGDAYIRLKKEQYDVLGGEAVLMPKGD